MQVIDELMIALGLKADGVKKGMQEAESAISSGLSSIKTKLGAIGAAFTAALSLGAAFQQYTQEADAMGKLADAIDVDISKLHAWGEAAARAGGSAAAFQGSIQSLTGQLARQATMGTSRAAKLLEGVGIDAGEIGRQRQAFDVMMDLAAKAEEMGKAEFFGLGRSLGLDQGTIMLLQQGRQALKDQIQAQKEFGVYTKEDARVTADFNDRMADFGQVFKSFASIIFRMVLPPVTKMLELFNKGIAFLHKHEHFVQAFFIGLAAIITTILIPAFASLAASILANPLTWLAAALAAVALVIEDLVVWAEGGEAAFGELWKAIFGSPEEAMATWDSLKKFIENVWTSIKNFCLNIWNEMDDDFNTFVQRMIRVIDGIKSAFESVANVVRSIFKTAEEGAAKIGDVQTMDTSQFADVPHEAEGGILTYPTHALVAEAGPEAIIPLSNQRRGRALDILGAIAPIFAPKQQQSPLQDDGILSRVASVLGDFAGMAGRAFEDIGGQNIPVILDASKLVVAADALPAGGSVSNITNANSSETKIGSVNIYTQADDAQGIADSVPRALEHSLAGFTAMQADFAY